MSITIRPAAESDAERVGNLAGNFADYLRELGDPTNFQFTSETYLRDGFGLNPAFSGLVADSSDQGVIGYLLYHFGYDTDRAMRIMTIADLYVDTHSRSQGVGKALMNQAKSICQEREISEMTWAVYKPNQQARDFYLALGAKDIEDLDFMYQKVDL